MCCSEIILDCFAGGASGKDEKDAAPIDVPVRIPAVLLMACSSFVVCVCVVDCRRRRSVSRF